MLTSRRSLSKIASRLAAVSAKTRATITDQELPRRKNLLSRKKVTAITVMTAMSAMTPTEAKKRGRYPRPCKSAMTPTEAKKKGRYPRPRTTTST